MDNKSGLFYRFLERLAKRWKCPKERLWRALACLHAAVITKSLHIPDLIDEPKWMDGSPSECAQIVSNFVAVGKAKKAERGYLPQTDRFSITGLSYVTRQVSKKGGEGKKVSLAGWADGTKPELSIFTYLERYKSDLHAANSKGAEQLLAELQSKTDEGKSKYPGAGELVSQRTLTYIEPSGLVRNVVRAYMPGGSGTRFATQLPFVLAGGNNIDVEAAREMVKKMNMPAFLTKVKTNLEKCVRVCSSRPPEYVQYGRI